MALAVATAMPSLPPSPSSSIEQRHQLRLRLRCSGDHPPDRYNPHKTTVKATLESAKVETISKQKRKMEDTFHVNAQSLHFMDASYYASLLQICGDMNDVGGGKQLHAFLVKDGGVNHHLLKAKLVIMYSKCDCLADARLVFDTLDKRDVDVYSWLAIIRGYCRQGYFKEVLQLYNQMQQKKGDESFRPEKLKLIFPIVLKACAALDALQEGKDIHDYIIALGFDSDPFVESALVSMYAKCGSIEDARQVFDKISQRQRDNVSWNAMIAGFANTGHEKEALEYFGQMQLSGVKPKSSAAFACILSACARLAALRQGREIHCHVIRQHIPEVSFSLDVVGSALVHMYAKCGCMEDALRVFNKMSNRNVVSWNAMIAGYVENGRCGEALRFFRDMEMENVKPSSVTIVAILQGCTGLAALGQGREVHGYAIRHGFTSETIVLNSVASMYAKCRALESALQVFDANLQTDVVSWNVTIMGYANYGHGQEALQLFRLMQLAGKKPDTVTILGILPACAIIADVQRGKELHSYSIRNGFYSDFFVESALVDMYAKCGNLQDARKLFDSMPKRDVVSWTAIIAGYSQNGHGDEAFKLFCQMQLAGLKPNSLTVVSVIPACALLASLKHGKQIHNYIIRSGFELDAFVGSALIDMYAKCGAVMDARSVFDRISKRNVVVWNAMIVGYAMHGHGEDALLLFREMQQADMKPDRITFTGILSACNHAGLLDESKQYFSCMSRDYSITPDVDHYACMVDLLGRAGCLDEAHNLINSMPVSPNACVWGALLSACRIHRNVKLGEHVAQILFELEPENPGNYVLLSNIYAVAGMWEDVARVRKMMKDKGLRKTPGWSWIEVNNRVHSFLVGDRSHPQTEKIYSMLENMSRKMAEAGIVPDTNFVLHDVIEKEKEHMLCGHSEKLAIAFGLLNTSPETPIRVIKNLRVCGDCHTTTKFISKVVGREIILRDTSRFHHFKDGVCTCGDYW